MLESRHRSYAEKVSLSPLKKVTFYGPVSTTKVDQLHHVGGKRTPRRTLFSNDQRSIGTTQGLTSNKERPHSKTAVVGHQIKTRLNCNHMKPRCDACSTKKNLSPKLRHKTFVSLMPRQSHVLASSRNVPRGGTDGRKLYGREDVNESVSVLDAGWKLGKDHFSVRQKSMSGRRNSNQEDTKGSRQSSEEGLRKKVQFVDKAIGSSNSGNSTEIRTDYSENHRSYNTPSIHSASKNVSRQEQEETGSSKLSYSSKDRKCFSYTKTEDARKGCPETSSDHEVDVHTVNESFCSLCESLGYRCLEHSEFHPGHSSKRDHAYIGRKRTHSVPRRSSSADDLCLLCRRYGKNHYYVDEDCCRLCDEVPYRCGYLKPGREFSSSVRNARLAHHRRLVRPQRGRWSTPMFYSDGEEEGILQRNIPYEPKTDYVKDMKKKLEDEYRQREYLQKRRNLHQQWRSWDAEDLDELRNYRMRKSEDPWAYVPQHKCVHHYMQNDRLFLEPTYTDEDGSSLCSECGAPKPQDPIKDPYLYHITLGGLREGKRCDKENVHRSYRDSFPTSRSFSSKTLHQNFKPSKRLPGDTSKHLYAKLNRNIHNILPLSSHYSLRPPLADQLRYRADPITKRHPSRSMALVDHLV